MNTKIKTRAGEIEINSQDRVEGNGACFWLGTRKHLFNNEWHPRNVPLGTAKIEKWIKQGILVKVAERGYLTQYKFDLAKLSKAKTR